MDKFNDKKRRSQEVIQIAIRVRNYEQMNRNIECGAWLKMIANYELTKKIVFDANFCNWRFCPMCAMIKAGKTAMQILTMMKYITAEHGKEFIFVTLTAPRVRKEELKDAINRYNKAFNNLMKRDEILKMSRGFIRKLEVTYDGEPKITKAMYEQKKDYFKRRGLRAGDPNPNYDTYFPHFHVVFAVDTSYFKMASRYYVNREKWLDLWRQCMRDDSITQVDVRKVKANTDPNELASFDFDVAEFAKYTAKDADYQKDGAMSQEVFEVFYKTLKGRQLLTFGGLFKDSAKKYKNKELDKYIDRDETDYYWLLIYNFNFEENEYNKESILPLDEDFKKIIELNKSESSKKTARSWLFSKAKKNKTKDDKEREQNLYDNK